MHEVKNIFLYVWGESRCVAGSEGQRRCTNILQRLVSQLHTVSVDMYQRSPPHGSASHQCPHFHTLCSNFSTTSPKPPCLHNEFSQSDYSCTILLPVIIKQELKLRTFVSYYFNRAISMSPRWPSPSSVIINLIASARSVTVTIAVHFCCSNIIAISVIVSYTLNDILSGLVHQNASLASPGKLNLRSHAIMSLSCVTKCKILAVRHWSCNMRKLEIGYRDMRRQNEQKLALLSGVKWHLPPRLP